MKTFLLLLAIGLMSINSIAQTRTQTTYKDEYGNVILKSETKEVNQFGNEIYEVPDYHNADMGGAVFLGDPTVRSSNQFVKNFNTLQNEKESIEKSIANFLEIDKTGWFRHHKEIKTKHQKLIAHVNSAYLEKINPFQGKTGFITRELKYELLRTIEYSKQLRELYQIDLTILQDRQQDLTVESIQEWTDYWNKPLEEQIQQLPPMLIEKQK